MSLTETRKISERLNVKQVLDVLQSDGPLALSLKGFESREEQKGMMRNVIDAYNQKHIALIEAGTGTGKSLAYLIPAMLWACETKERTVISTNTIPLQEQLLKKDIPVIEKALKLNLHAVIVKGMNNYLCLRKFDETQQEMLLLSPQETEELQKLEVWKEKTSDGSRSSIPFPPSSALWEKISAESDTCNRNDCPYFQKCHFFKARREAEEAQILIVNHHMLFADLVCRAENPESNDDNGILPSYDRVILDEAHNIEDIATEYFASSLNQMDILRLMARLTSEKGNKVSGKLSLLKEKLLKCYGNDHDSQVSSIYNRLIIDLPGLRRDLIQQTYETFEAFFDFTQLMQQESVSAEDAQNENKLRILSYHHTHPHWNNKLIPLGQQLSSSIQKFTQSLNALADDIKRLNNPLLDEQTKGILFEIGALAIRFETLDGILKSFISALTTSTKVRWIESQALKKMIITSIVEANLDISKILAEHLFSKFSTVVLCSATLTANRHFDFIRGRLGLTDELLPNRSIREYIYDSPFDYKTQALFAIPTDVPNPSDPEFLKVASEKIWQAIQSSHGNAFVLFTSYGMLKLCFDLLERRLKELRYNPLRQGDEDRHSLLHKFKTIDRSVLFGTDSFWEGVDVVGEALRCVIIVKLPFKVPTEPIIQARSEQILAKGGDPFMEYSLPQAIVKFKQGFGRLIRHKRDRGCIVCLDNRIKTKRYGKLFLDSLPSCQQAFVTGDDFQQKMKDFYRRTYFLVKS